MESIEFSPEQFGSLAFRRDYGIRYAYLTGAMYKGIASKELVVVMGKSGLMGFFGTGGLPLNEVDDAIRFIQSQLDQGQSYGMNLLHQPYQPDAEMQQVALYLARGVRFVEASAFIQMTPALVRFRLTGIHRNEQDEVVAPNHILAKLSRPEIADLFMRPAPEKIVAQLVSSGALTEEEARLSRHLPMAQDICVEADSGGHTDRGNASVLMPAMQSLRERMQAEFAYDSAHAIRIGAAGGIGTPQAALAAFMLGADFIMTGSINQCTVEAGTSAAVKELLQELNVQDTTYAPAGDMFEMGAQVQVVRRGVLFPVRANKLHELYSRCNSLDDIDARTKQQIEDKFFKRTFNDVWLETRAHYQKQDPGKIAAIENSPKQKMAAVFKWYFFHSTQLALTGSAEQRVDYQIHCGPALGAFNQWVHGTRLQDWRKRHVAEIAELLMQETASLCTRRVRSLSVGAF
jgi:trans-AT polyketide synthase, acyltransferase and oxidoreductase domains